MGSTERGGTWIDWPQAVIHVQDPSAWESVMSVNPVVFIWWQVVQTAPQFAAVLGPAGNSWAWSICKRDVALVVQPGARQTPSRARTNLRSLSGR